MRCDRLIWGVTEFIYEMRTPKVKQSAFHKAATAEYALSFSRVVEKLSAMKRSNNFSKIIKVSDVRCCYISNGIIF